MDEMRAIQLSAPGEFGLRRLAVPEPSAGEALVEIEVCGVCGSDVHLVDGTTAADYPVTLGHEAAGRVVALGPDTNGVNVGSRVAVLPYVACESCASCRAARPQACSRRAVLGVHRAGAQADFLAMPVECLVPLPASVPSEVGAILTDAVATPYHAIRQAGPRAGHTAVVFGLGGLGLHAVPILTDLYGCTVFGVDPRPQARRRAEQLGAARTFDATPDVVAEITRSTGDGADMAFEFVGHPDVLSSALRCLRPRGSCVVVGIGPDRLALNLRQETLVGRELRLSGSFGCDRDELVELVELVAAGRLELAGSVSRQYRPEEFDAALAETRDKNAGSVRVAVRYA